MADPLHRRLAGTAVANFATSDAGRCKHVARPVRQPTGAGYRQVAASSVLTQGTRPVAFRRQRPKAPIELDDSVRISVLRRTTASGQNNCQFDDRLAGVAAQSPLASVLAR